MSPEFRNIEVGFRFDGSDIANKDVQVEIAKSILFSGERTVIEQEVIEGGITCVTLRAIVSDEIAKLPHGFENLLIEPFPGGAGAGYVGEFSGELTFDTDKT
jgi:hypothetical protein